MLVVLLCWLDMQPENVCPWPHGNPQYIPKPTKAEHACHYQLDLTFPVETMWFSGLPIETARAILTLVSKKDLHSVVLVSRVGPSLAFSLLYQTISLPQDDKGNILQKIIDESNFSLDTKRLIPGFVLCLNVAGTRTPTSCFLVYIY
jgi:hypothetical protein